MLWNYNTISSFLYPNRSYCYLSIAFTTHSLILLITTHPVNSSYQPPVLFSYPIFIRSPVHSPIHPSSLLFSTNTPREEPTHHRSQNRLPLHSHHIRHVSHRTHVIRHHDIERLVRKLPRLPSNPPLSPTFSPKRITSRSPGSPRTLFSGRIM